jgi:cobalt/nickel transport system permease protein
VRDLYVPRQSPLHRLDARVKILLALAYILFLNLTPFSAWPVYLLFLLISIAAALISRLGIVFLLKRALLALPFVLAALPLIFTFPGPRLPLAGFPAAGWTYSPAGLERFAAIAVRSWLSVQAAVLLAAATPFPALLAGLRQLGMPRVFAAVIGLMFRYLTVIGEEAARMLRARLSRSARVPGSTGSRGSLSWRAHVTGGMAGSLLLRSLERSDRVYAAMLSRGYHGEPTATSTVPLNRKEITILLVMITLLCVFWLAGLALGG